MHPATVRPHLNLRSCFAVPPKKLSFRFRISLSDMTNYKSAFGKVCRFKNRHTFKSMTILNSAYFTECRFVIRHITQTDTETETEPNFTHVSL